MSTTTAVPTTAPVSPFQDDPLFTVDEAAAALRLKPMTIWGMLAGNKLQRTKVGGKTFVRRSQLELLVVDGARSSRADRAAPARRALAAKRKAAKSRKPRKAKRAHKAGAR